MLKVKSKLYLAALCVLAMISSLVLYSFGGILDRNSYAGLHELSSGFDSLLISIIWGCLIFYFLPKKISLPSDIFLFFYLAFCLIWGAGYWSVSGQADFYFGLSMLCIGILPVILFKGIRQIIARTEVRKLARLGLFSSSWRIWALGLLLLTSALVGVTAFGGGGFDWELMYDRRISARESFGVGTIPTYLFAMSINGVMPVMAFIGGRRGNFLITGLAIAYAVFGFWLIGVKAPFLYAMIMWFLGFLLRKEKFEYFHGYVLLGLNLVLLAALVEMLFGESFISELFVRRAMVIPPFLQGVYVDYVLSTFSDLDSWIFGKKLDVGIAIYIGQDYLGMDNLNANTNAFMYALASGGVALYLLAIFFVSFVFAVIDSAYKWKKDEIFLPIGAMYGLLLTEQAFGTAFLSSGIFLCLLVAFLFSRNASPVE
ncbi:hypothetical protein CY658_15110 [Variovorax sp. RO1]|uniref:hypothetical protein n=1 Tax=Variovorax sp. RO1 TaxID=2066034 RepID=UPI000C717CB9|nr:hypothetical protein [Variovorax sp. RO1]PLC05122.1 hypothetical protein CY658_15110 [Variovorax sp. RO1]